MISIWSSIILSPHFISRIYNKYTVRNYFYKWSNIPPLFSFTFFFLLIKYISFFSIYRYRSVQYKSHKRTKLYISDIYNNVRSMMKNNKNEKAKISHVTTVNRNIQCTDISGFNYYIRHAPSVPVGFRISYRIYHPFPTWLLRNIRS